MGILRANNQTGKSETTEDGNNIAEIIYAGGGKVWQRLRWEMLTRYSEIDMAVKWAPVVAREMWRAELGSPKVLAAPEVAELTREFPGASRVGSRWNLCRQENVRAILSLGAVDEVTQRLEEAGIPEAAQKARRLCGAAADALNEMKNGFKREEYEQRDREATNEDTCSRACVQA